MGGGDDYRSLSCDMDEEEIRGWNEVGLSHCRDNGELSYLSIGVLNMTIKTDEGIFEVETS